MNAETLAPLGNRELLTVVLEQLRNAAGRWACWHAEGAFNGPPQVQAVLERVVRDARALGPLFESESLATVLDARGATAAWFRWRECLLYGGAIAEAGADGVLMNTNAPTPS